MGMGIVPPSHRPTVTFEGLGSLVFLHRCLPYHQMACAAVDATACGVRLALASCEPARIG